MASSRQRGAGLGIAAVVFVVGAGLGFTWRQGWLPMELLPAQTGVLDQLAEESDQDPPAPLIPAAPIAEHPLPRAAATAAASEFDAAIFEQQSEPAPATSEAQSTGDAQRGPPRRLVSPSPGETPLVAGTVSSGRSVQPAAFAETASSPQASLSDADNFDLSMTLAEFDEKVQNGEILAAHRLLSQVYWKQRAHRPQLQEHLDRTAAAIFFQPQPHFVEPYVIEPGDRLEAIAAEYKVPWEYLSKLNRTDPKRIQAGRRLKVVRGPFAAVVELTDFSLTVHLQGYYVRRFSVGIGRDGASPIGKFSVLNKVVNPQYTDPDGRVIASDDPANPLGERWIDLGNSYGIHGTIDPDSIGKAASRGCIRLGHDEIVTVYDFLSVGSDVVLRR